MEEKSVHVVGIGASAGGLDALKRFFAAVPEETGVAWVVVVHLPSESGSRLADLLQPHAPIPVLQVTETTSLDPDRVYVIPPGSNLTAVDSHLRLSPLEERGRRRAPVDHFFRTLADAQDGHAVAVVLTGTGSDGAQGVRRIHEAGGIVVVQDPAEAEWDGMPRSALATGVADLVLPVAEMPRRILDFRRPAHEAETEGPGEAPDLLPDILAQVRARTGYDFARYRRTTLQRRVERRMQLGGVPDVTAYLKRLRGSADEARALAEDLLITVTRFFRDVAVFQHLEQHVIPAIFEGRGAGGRVRAWSVGCATGEEAYSLAMLLVEEAARHEHPPEVQVFATDLHQRSLQHAREGLYPETISDDVAPERLARFFVQEHGGYRVRQELRDRVVFAAHDVLGDAPFSRLDLVTCRNVMIYLQRDVQDRVIELFHYALNPGGFMLLGTAESVERPDLFRTENREHRVYRRRDVARRELRLPTMHFAAPRPAPSTPATPTDHESAAEPLLGYGALHERMAERYSPPSVLVGADHAVLHVSRHAGRFLQLSGTPSANVFQLVREELRTELRAALHLAPERRAPSRSRPIPVKLDGVMRHVVLRVSPAGEAAAEGLHLVMFDELEDASPRDDAPAAPATRELEAELAATRARLRVVAEEFEAHREEMQASHEELQSANEELRSTMEELETSREELQSINEELQTVNQENRHRVEELSQLSGDLQNLLSSTDVATLFLDRSLRILRFTPRVGELFNVRQTDRGRPLADLTHRLGYGELLGDAQAVLRTLAPVEREVGDERGHWYLTRVLPYRSGDHRIEGVVLTFVDITARRQAEQALRASEEKYRSLFESIDEGFCIIERVSTAPLDFRYIEANPAFAVESGVANVVGKTIRQVVPEEPEEWFETYDRVLRTGESVRFQRELVSAGRVLELYAFPVQASRLAVIFKDITARRRAEEEIHQARVYAESIVETLHEPLLVLTPDLRVRSVNQAFYDHFQVRREETHGRLIYELGNGQWDIPELRTLLEDVLPDSNVFNDYEVTHEFEDIGRRVMLLNARRLDHVQFILLGIRDITEKKRAEERQAFLLRLSDALRPLSDPVGIQRTAMRVLGEQLEVDRVLYSEIDDGEATYAIADNYLRGDLPKLVGRFPTADYGAATELLRAGSTVVVEDIASDERLSEAARASFLAFGVHASIGVPLVKDDRWVANLGIQAAAPRRWTGAEVALVEETAERTWAVVEQARAEAALRESEARQAFLLRLSDILQRLTAPTDIKTAAMHMLGTHLDVSRAQYHEVDESGEYYSADGVGYADDLPLLDLKYRIDQFGSFVAEDFEAGRPFRSDDLLADPRPTAEEREAYAYYGIRAGAGIPLLRGGKLVAILAVHDTSAHPWTDLEMEVIRETAERVWVAVERVRTETTLRENEARMQRVLSIETVGILFFDMDSNFLDANDAFLRMAGVERSALERGELRSERVTLPEWMPRTAQAFEELRATGRFSPYEKQLVRPDGTTWWALFAGARLGENECVEFVLDVTARREAEGALRDSEEKFRTLFDSIDEGLAIVEMIQDDDGAIVDMVFRQVNRAYERQGGLTDVVNRSVFDVMPGVEEYWLDAYRHVAATGEPIRMENHQQDVDRWFDVYFTRVDESGRFVAIVFNDITERKQREVRQGHLLSLSDALRTESDPDAVVNRALRMLAEQLGLDRCYVGVYRLAEDIAEFTHQVGNDRVPPLPRTARLSDFSESLQIATDRTLVINDVATDQRLSEADRQSLSALGLGALVVATLRRGDSAPFWSIVAVSAHPRQWRTSEIAHLEEVAERTWVARERAGAEAAMRELNETLERRVRERTAELIAAGEARRQALQRLVNAEEEERRRISRELHDHFGQQLTGLLLGLRALAPAASDPNRLRDLQQLADGIARDIQNMAVELRPPALDNLGLAETLHDHLEDWSRRHAVSADFHASGFDSVRLPREVETSLYRVAQEALTNVVKHAHASSVSLVLERRGGTVRLIVEDNGAGFDLEQLATSPDRAKRLGIQGMRERVALLGGEFEVESSPGGGTSLYVRVPIADS